MLKTSCDNMKALSDSDSKDDGVQDGKKYVVFHVVAFNYDLTKIQRYAGIRGGLKMELSRDNQNR